MVNSLRKSQWLPAHAAVTAFCLLAAFCGDARAVTRSGWVERSISVGGQSRHYLMFVPDDLPQGAPFVLILQGSHEGMRRLLDPDAGGVREWPLLARREKFLLVVPNGTNLKSGDTAGDRQDWRTSLPDPRQAALDRVDSGFILRMLDEVIRSRRADPSRIYLTGQSGGAVMAASLLLASPRRFAAAALFSSALPSVMAAGSGDYRPCPLMLVHGTADHLVPWAEAGRRYNGETVIPARESAGWWIVANRADAVAPATTYLPDMDPRDGCRIRRTEYRPLKGGEAVVHYVVEGGGHAIPSRRHASSATSASRRMTGNVCRDGEGAELAWAFLKGFRMLQEH